MRIAILCHWHTGSTLLAKTLRMCGMEVGNANTDWYPNCDPPCEHGRLNGLGDAFLLGSIAEEELRIGITQILTSYMEEAELKGWEHYGVKITHAVQKQTWPIFKELFDSLWNPVYVTTVRYPLGVVRSTEGDDKWSTDRILKSYSESIPAMKEIEKVGFSFLYPNDWITGEVKKRVEKIGLNWNSKAWDLFDPLRPKSFSEYALLNYAKEDM